MTNKYADWLPPDDSAWLKQRYQVYMPGLDGKYHIGDDNGGTLCGAKTGDCYCDKICDKCEAAKWLLTQDDYWEVGGDTDQITGYDPKWKEKGII